MFLLIDWGNTRLKYHLINDLAGFADNDADLADNKVSKTASSVGELVFKTKTADISHVLISSVRSDQDDEQLRQQFEVIGHRTYFAKVEKSNNGIQCAYSDPEKLGIDRWLTITAAAQVDQTVGIIDIGSAITLDIVQSQRHLGGHILPGGNLLKNSLLKTANVQVRQGVNDQSIKLNQLKLGQSTAECVDFGIEQMIGGYLACSMNQADCDHQVDQWFITGGGAKYWSKWLSTALTDEEYLKLTLSPNLVFRGLAQFFANKGLK